MKSLHLRLEQLDATTGRARLWEAPFPAAGDQAIADEQFPLAPLLATGAGAGQTRWQEILHQARHPIGAADRVFDLLGEELCKLLQPSGMFAQWQQPGAQPTRTFLDCPRAQPPGSPPAGFELDDLPWECLVIPQPGGMPNRLFANPRFPIVRVHKSAVVNSPSRPLLRALIVSGEPIAWGSETYPIDDIGAVLRECQTCDWNIHAEFLESPSLTVFEATLNRLQPDILHFGGHGELSPDGKPALRISRAGAPWWWDVGIIKQFFIGLDWRPRLVVLNACDTAVCTEFHSLLKVFADDLGVGAVVGAQATFPQPMAPILSRALYGGLAKGDPVDVVLADALEPWARWKMA